MRSHTIAIVWLCNSQLIPMKHFISIAELQPNELEHTLDVAARLKKQYRQRGRNDPLLAGKTLAMIFEKPSLRTRVSFAVAMTHLGGQGLLLREDEVGLGKPRIRAGRRPRSFRHVRRNHGPHLLASERRRSGQVVHRPRHQRPDRLQPSLPGDGRPDDHPGEVRRSAWPHAGLHRRRQQRGPVAVAGVREIRPSIYPGVARRV